MSNFKLSHRKMFRRRCISNYIYTYTWIQHTVSFSVSGSGTSSMPSALSDTKLLDMSLAELDISLDFNWMPSSLLTPDFCDVIYQLSFEWWILFQLTRRKLPIKKWSCRHFGRIGMNWFHDPRFRRALVTFFWSFAMIPSVWRCPSEHCFFNWVCW